MSRLAPSLRSLLSAVRRRRTTPADPVRRACAPVARRIACDLENLEQRRLLSTVSITGTSGNDTISLSVDGSGYVVQTVNGTPTNLGFLASSVTSISVDGGAGSDNINLSAVTTANGFTNASLPGNVTLTGGTGNDTITGSGVADSIVGGDGDDVMYGRAGNDTISGGLGSDNIMGDAGDDVLDAGSDGGLVNYSLDPAGVTASISSSATDGYGGHDTLSNFNGIYGSQYADNITGSSGDDYLGGLAGDDTINGGNGNDTITGGAGNDSLDGGGGTGDYLDYSGETAGVTVLLNSSATDGYGDTDSLAGFEDVYGSAYADNITGDAGSNLILAGDGDDTLSGGSGAANDFLNGGNGYDTYVLYGTAGNDSFTFSPGVAVVLGHNVFLNNLEFRTYVGNGGSDSLTLDAGTQVSLPSDVSADGTALSVSVAGTLDVSSAQHLASVSISSGGQVNVAPGAGLFSTKALTVSGTGALDLADNAAVVDYTGSSPIAAIRAALASGYDAGAWDGSGINTSTGPAVGYAEASNALGISGASTASWEGATVDATSVLIRTTYYGDADLDGDVDAYDFARANDGVSDLALTYARTPGDRPDHAFWSNGDFNYDTAIDADDYDLLYASAASYGSGVVDVSSLSGIHLDGTTDDRATIQSAINGASDGTIFLIPGTAAIAGQLNVASRSDLVFLGSTPGAGFAFTANSSGSYSAFLHVDDSSYVTIAGLDFDANDYTGSLIAISFSDHVTVRDDTLEDMDKDPGRYNSNAGAIFAYGNSYNAYVHNTLDDVTHGIYAGVSFIPGGMESHVVITDNFIQYTNATAMGVQASYADVERNTVQHVIGAGSGMTVSGGGEALIFDTTEHYTVRDNSFSDIAWTGIQSDVWTSGAYPTVSPQPLYDILVENNSIDTAGVSGVYITTADSWVVTNNNIANTGTGIAFGQGDNIAIDTNTIDNAATGMTVGSGDNIAVTSNHITDSNYQYGAGVHIWVYGSGATLTNFLFADNLITSGAGTGLVIKLSDGGTTLTGTISGNTITNNTYSGLDIVSGSGTLTLGITGNTILDNPEYGVLVDAPTGTLSLNGGNNQTASDLSGTNTLSGGVDPDNGLGEELWK